MNRRKEYEAQKPEHKLGDAPVEQAYHAKMVTVMSAVDSMFNGENMGPDREVGVVMMVFALGDKGRCNYMSNGVDRKDIVVLMKEMIARFEGQPEMSGHA